MEENVIENNIRNREVGKGDKYSNALLELRHQYISTIVQELYDLYEVNDQEELTSSIIEVSQAEELDEKVSKIKEKYDKYIPAVFQLGIRGSLDPTAEYVEEVIWSQEKMGIGVESFVVDFNNNIVVSGTKGIFDKATGNLHILDSTNGYTPTKIWSEEMGIGSFDRSMRSYLLDSENNILVSDGEAVLHILNKANNYKPIIIEPLADAFVDEFRSDLKNNIVARDGWGNVWILDRSNGDKFTTLGWRSLKIWSVRPILDGKMVARDARRNLYILDKSNGYQFTQIWYAKVMGGMKLEKDSLKLEENSFKLDLENNIVIIGNFNTLFFLDRSNDYKSTKIWSGEDILEEIKTVRFDLENNILFLDSSDELHLLDSSNKFKTARFLRRGVTDFQVDLENNIVVADRLGSLFILDRSNNYRSIKIGNVKEARTLLLDYEGNIIVSSVPEQGFFATNLSILKPKKKK